MDAHRLFEEPIRFSEGLELSKDLIIERIRNANTRALDVGCGSGALLELMSKYPVEVYGLDIRLSLNDTTRAKGIVADANNLPFRNRSFDLITSIGLMDSLTITQIKSVLGEIYSALSDDGTLVFVDINYYSPFIRIPNFYHAYKRTILTPKKWIQIMKECRFKDLVITKRGKAANKRFPRVIRFLIDKLVPNRMADRITILAQKQIEKSRSIPLRN